MASGRGTTVRVCAQALGVSFTEVDVEQLDVPYQVPRVPRRAARGLTMDHRRFLGLAGEVCAPVVAGYAWLADRRLRIVAGDGWWRVRVRGRMAESIATAGPDEAVMASLPVVRGHVVPARGGVLLVVGGGLGHPVDLAPADEVPPPLAPAVARRWPAGDLLLWERLDWPVGDGEPVGGDDDGAPASGDPTRELVPSGGVSAVRVSNAPAPGRSILYRAVGERRRSAGHGPCSAGGPMGALIQWPFDHPGRRGAAPATQRPPCLLVVEDNPRLRAELPALLARRRLAGTVTTDGSAVLHRLVQSLDGPRVSFDAVIVDIDAPGRSGFDVLAAVRAGRWPVRVVLTALFATRSLRAEVLRRGASGLLDRPVTAKEWDRVLRTVARA